MYDDDVWFMVKEIMVVVWDVGLVFRELYAMGVVYGDVYAYNILYVKEFLGIELCVKFGDFGVVWFYERDLLNVWMIEFNEVWVFGVVLEEVCARYDGVDGVYFIVVFVVFVVGLFGECGSCLLFDDIV